MTKVTVQGTVSYTVEVEEGEDWRRAAWVAQGGLGLVCKAIEDSVEAGRFDALEGEVEVNGEAFDGVALVDGQAYDI